jgi:hypothetical protein
VRVIGVTVDFLLGHLVALRAEAVTDLGFGMVGNILVKVLPDIFIDPHFSALRADDDQSLEEPLLLKISVADRDDGDAEYADRQGASFEKVWMIRAHAELSFPPSVGQV